MKPIERWLDILDYEGYYQVSNAGRVRSLDRIINGRKFTGKLIKPLNKRGYMQVNLKKAGTSRFIAVHRLVLQAFIGPSKLTVNHKNGVKADNRLENLEYCTIGENHKHAFRTGLKNHKGENHSQAKLTNADIHAIRKDSRLQKEIAKEYGIIQQTVSDIKRKKRWSHI